MMTVDLSSKEWTARLENAIAQGQELDTVLDSPVGGRVAIPGPAIRSAVLQVGAGADPSGLVIRNARIVGPLNLAFARVGFPLGFIACEFDEEPNFTGSHLAALALSDSELPSIRLDQMKVDHFVALDGVRVTSGTISAPGVSVGGDVNLDRAILDSNGATALDLEGARIEQCLFLREGFTATGSLNLLGIDIAGQLILKDASLMDADADAAAAALVLDGALIGRGFFFIDGSTSKGAIRLVGAEIGGQLNFKDSSVSSCDSPALSFDHSTVKAGVFIERMEIDGTVEGKFANVSGLDFRESRLTVLAGDALWLDGTVIRGDLGLTRLDVHGQLTLMGVRVDGQLVLNGTTVVGSGDYGVCLDGARISEDLTFDAGFASDRQIRLEASTVGATVSFRGSRLDSEGVSVTMDRASVAGDVLLDGAFVARGELSIEGCSINGRLVIANRSAGSIVNLRSARIFRLEFLLAKRADSDPSLVDFSGAEIGLLTARDEMALPSIASMAGWRVDSLAGPLASNRAMAARWLMTASQASTQPWAQIADVYARNGLVSDARWLRYRGAVRKNAKRRRGGRLLGWTYSLVAGHGYYPLRAIVGLLGVGLAAFALAVIYSGDFHPSAVTYSATSLSVEISGATPCEEIQGVACFEPRMFAVQTALPVAGSSLVDAWQVSPHSWVAWSLLGLRALAWALVAILLAGVTGLLKKT